jgi:hypothetical protein
MFLCRVLQLALLLAMQAVQDLSVPAIAGLAPALASLAALATAAAVVVASAAVAAAVEELGCLMML